MAAITKEQIQKALELFIPIAQNLAAMTPTRFDDQIVAVVLAISKSGSLMEWLYSIFAISQNKIVAGYDANHAQALAVQDCCRETPDTEAIRGKFSAMGVKWEWVQQFLTVALPILLRLIADSTNTVGCAFDPTLSGVAQASEPVAIPTPAAVEAAAVEMTQEAAALEEALQEADNPGPATSDAPVDTAVQDAPEAE